MQYLEEERNDGGKKNLKEKFSLLNDVYVPSEWCEKVIDENVFNKTYEKYMEYGIKYKLYDPNDKLSLKQYKVRNHILVGITYRFYPNVTEEEYELGWLLMYTFIVLDKFSDDLFNNGDSKSIEISENAKKVIKEFEDILIRPNRSYDVEYSFDNVSELNGAILFKARTNTYCKCHGVEGIGNSMMATFIDFMDNFEPYANFKNGDLETYLYMRKTNIGAMSCIELGMLIEIRKLDPMLFYSSGYFKKICYGIAKSITFSNDIISYEKEIASNTINNNCLNQLIVGEKKLSFKEAYYFLVEKLNNVHKEMLIFNDGFLKEIILNLKDHPEKEILILEFKNALKRAMYCISGNFLWSLENIRYSTKDSIFIELDQCYQKHKEFYENKSFIQS